MAETRYLNLANKVQCKKYKLTQDNFSLLVFKRLGETVDLATFGLQLTGSAILTGGSSKTGTPMCSAVPGTGYKKIRYKQNLAKGKQRRLRVHGGQISPEIVVIEAKYVG